ncbi:sodium/proline symporter [Ihubacter sp. mB4P-1]|uniref:sodium/proline symporter n=1 Tax=Ihubacter sp. mB4P-1 TaxID=3242370 RepID=UPI003C7C2411
MAYLIPMVVYLLFMIGIGFYFSKKQSSLEGFFLGDRSLGSWVVAFSYAFSGMSAWVLIGYVGVVYAMGPSSFYILIGFNLGFMAGYLVYGKRLRNYSELLGAVTYTEFFTSRVRTCTALIRIISALSIIIFMSAYVASQLAATGKTMSIVFGMPYGTIIVIVGIVIAAYCLIGGFSAVAVNDFVQGVLIVIGVVILAAVVVVKAGGPSEIASAAAAIDPNLVTATLGGKTGMALVGAVIGQLLFGVQCLGRPHDTIRFFTIKDATEIKKSLVVCLASLTITYWAAFAIGYGGRVLYPELADPEQLFAILLSSGLIHPVFAGILLTIFLGLMMSTVSSQLLSAGTTLAEDVIHKYIMKHSSEKEIVRVSQISIAVIAAAGIVFAVNSTDSVFNLTNYATSGLSATYAAVLLLALYWKKLTGPGCFFGMVGGFAICIIWQSLGLSAIVLSGIPGTIGSFIIAIVVSIFTKQEYEGQIEIELSKITKKIE